MDLAQYGCRVTQGGSTNILIVNADDRRRRAAHLLLIVAVANLVSDLPTELAPKLRLLPLAVVGAAALLAAARWEPSLRVTRRSAPGYADASWRQSPFLAAVRALPTSVPTFTNAGDAAWLIDRRSTYLCLRFTTPVPNQSTMRSTLG
jgi:hypothetical protein